MVKFVQFGRDFVAILHQKHGNLLKFLEITFSIYIPFFEPFFEQK